MQIKGGPPEKYRLDAEYGKPRIFVRPGGITAIALKRSTYAQEIRAATVRERKS